MRCIDLLIIRNHQTSIISNNKPIGFPIVADTFLHILVLVYLEDPPVGNIYDVEIAVGGIDWPLEKDIRCWACRAAAPLCWLACAAEVGGDAGVNFRLDGWGGWVEVHFESSRI